MEHLSGIIKAMAEWFCSMKKWIFGIAISFSAAAFADLAWLRYQVVEIRFVQFVETHCKLRAVVGQRMNDDTVVEYSRIDKTIEARLNDELKRSAGHRIEFDGFENFRIWCREKDPVPVPVPVPAPDSE